MAQAIGVIFTVCYVNWYMVFPAFFFIAAIIGIRNVYIISARDIKRIQAMGKF